MKYESLDFYRDNTLRYSELSHDFTNSVYTDSSHPGLRDDMDLLRRISELAPGKRGLDAGCGPGGRNVHLLNTWGLNVDGIDAVEENIDLSKELHTEISDKLQVVDIGVELPFDDAAFDFVMCNGVIQHLPPETTENITVPEFVRVLASGGILQLMFKIGSGVVSVLDKAYGSDSVERTFQLYDEHRLVSVLENLGCSVVPSAGENELGGLIYFNDHKPMRYCVFWARKT